VLSWRIGPRLGAFAAHRSGARPAAHNLAYTAAGVLLILFALPFSCIGSGYIISKDGFYGIAFTPSGIGRMVTNLFAAVLGGGVVGLFIAYKRRQPASALLGPLAGVVIERALACFLRWSRLAVDQAFLDAYRQACFGDRPLTPPRWLTASTPAELAALVGVDVDTFEQTLRTFNEAAVVGKDPEFGRGPAGRDERSDDVVAHFEPLHPWSQLPYDPGPLVSSTYWQARGMQVALGEVVVAVAQAGCRRLNEDLAVLGFIKLDFLDNPFAGRLPQQCRSCLH
jgi:hypothetical protein